MSSSASSSSASSSSSSASASSSSAHPSFLSLRPAARVRLFRADSQKALGLLHSAIGQGVTLIAQGNSSATAAGIVDALDKHNEKLVSADMKRRVDAAKADIIAGKLKVIDYTVGGACK